MRPNACAVVEIETEHYLMPMDQPLHEPEGGITAEIMAVIEEAAAAYLGRPVRILSVRVHRDVESQPKTWADQGRNVLQTSHNLVQRGH
jgi:hypothetical protein